MKIPILRVRDENGNYINIPAIQGPPGPPGSGGDGGGLQMASVQMMPGWARGDVDGDGEITVLDLGLARSLVDDPDMGDEQMLWCADADGDGVVAPHDADDIESYITGNGGIADKADYYYNWMYDSDKELYYYDLAVAAVTRNSNAVVVVQGTHKRGAFHGAECLDGAVRVYAEKLPSDYFNCLVLHMAGDGTALVIPENTAESTAPLAKLRIASATPGSTKVYTAEIDDDGYWLINEE